MLSICTASSCSFLIGWILRLFLFFYFGGGGGGVGGVSSQTQRRAELAVFLRSLPPSVLIPEWHSRREITLTSSAPNETVLVSLPPSRLGFAVGGNGWGCESANKTANKHISQSVDAQMTNSVWRRPREMSSCNKLMLLGMQPLKMLLWNDVWDRPERVKAPSVRWRNMTLATIYLDS